MMKMTLEEAEERLFEIATGDKEREALETIVFACDRYRALYEGAEKRLMRFRDMASKPDIPDEYMPEENKEIEEEDDPY